jgi:DNA-binding Xre family transcriptional regulator
MTTNNLKFLRIRRRLTIDRLVEITEIPKTTLQRLENTGSKKVLDKYRNDLAQALNCAPEDLDAADIGEGVPIVGEVKFKCFVKALPESKWKEAEPIEGLPQSARAIRIATPNLAPSLFRNDILYYDPESDQKPGTIIDKQCFVEIPKGNQLIVWLTQGSKPGHYMLHQYGAPHIMVDQKIVRAHPILYVKRT